jgi:hypothetical protein
MATPRVFPHGPLTEFAPGNWTVRGTIDMPIHRNMGVHRLRDGGLLLYSVVALDERGLAALTELGPPRIMVVPHAKHSMDASFYKERFPDLVVAAPDDSKAEIEGRRKVKVDGSPSSLLPEFGLRSHRIPGIRYEEPAMEVPVGGRWGMYVCDSLSQSPGRDMQGIGGWAFSLFGTSAGHFGVSRLFRWMMMNEKAPLKRWLDDQASRDDLAFVWVAHGDPLVTDVSGTLGHAAAAL